MEQFPKGIVITDKECTKFFMLKQADLWSDTLLSIKAKFDILPAIEIKLDNKNYNAQVDSNNEIFANDHQELVEKNQLPNLSNSITIFSDFLHVEISKFVR